MHIAQDGTRPFTTAACEDVIGDQAARLVARGHRVDSALLHPVRRHRRVRSFLRYAARHNAIRQLPNHTWEIRQIETEMHVLPGEVGYQHYPFAYAWHEYQEMTEACPISTPVEAASSASAREIW